MYAENPLHRARLGLGISLTELAARTCLSPRIVQKIDAGQFDQLPGGLYARSYVRTFAAFLNLDPEQIVRELSDHLPPDEDPFPVLRENARTQMPAWLATATEWPGRAVAWASARSWAPRQPPRLSYVPPIRCAAVLVDAGALFLLYAVFVRMTAWTLGVAVHDAIELAGLAVAVPWSVLVMLYFVILGGIGGRTPGAAVCGLQATRTAEPLDPRSICLRAFSWTVGWIPHRPSEPAGRWRPDSRPLDAADSRV